MLCVWVHFVLVFYFKTKEKCTIPNKNCAQRSKSGTGSKLFHYSATFPDSRMLHNNDTNIMGVEDYRAWVMLRIYTAQ